MRSRLKTVLGKRFSGYEDLIPNALRAKRESGKPLWRQFREMSSLRAGSGKIMPDEYFAHRLFDDKRFDDRARREFVGQFAKHRVYRANARSWRVVGDDKLVGYALFDSYGIRYPTLRAVFHPSRIHPRVLMLRTGEQVGDYLRSADYPLFAKPSFSWLGEGAWHLVGIDSVRDVLEFADGSRAPVRQFVEQEVLTRPNGLLFQDLVRPHPAIVEICGPRVASVRMMVLNTDAGPVLHRCAWRIPTGRNMIDNFRHGASGNLLASVNEKTGRVERVVDGFGLDAREIERHPDSGRILPGFQLPDWSAMVDCCLEATRAFPGLVVQSWDVVPTIEGPVFIELNTFGDLDVLQLAHGYGIADERWRRTVEN